MKSFGRWLSWLLLAGVALQMFFIARIAVMAAIDPVSTAFMRSEAWRVAGASLGGDKTWRWSHQWVDNEQISPHLKRAVIASEDAGFIDHGGVDWEAIEGAWQKNVRRQQLAKNLLLSGERQFLRKGQELVLALALEALLDKRRILEIYLNSVEWGEGVFGAEAAAQRYFGKPASKLNAHEAARLAVMLPSPKFFETRQGSAYLARRTGTIAARMGAVHPP